MRWYWFFGGCYFTIFPSLLWWHRDLIWFTGLRSIPHGSMYPKYLSYFNLIWTENLIAGMHLTFKCPNLNFHCFLANKANTIDTQDVVFRLSVKIRQRRKRRVQLLKWESRRSLVKTLFKIWQLYPPKKLSYQMENRVKRRYTQTQSIDNFDQQESICFEKVFLFLNFVSIYEVFSSCSLINVQRNKYGWSLKLGRGKKKHGGLRFVPCTVSYSWRVKLEITCIHPLYRTKQVLNDWGAQDDQSAHSFSKQTCFRISPELPTPASWWYSAGCPCGKRRPWTRTPDKDPHKLPGEPRGPAHSSGWRWSTCIGPFSQVGIRWGSQGSVYFPGHRWSLAPDLFWVFFLL